MDHREIPGMRPAPGALVRRACRRAVLTLLACFAGAAGAGTVRVDVPLDYRLVQDAIVAQVFTGPGHSVSTPPALSGCITLTLTEPRIDAAAGRVRLVSRVVAHNGSPLPGGGCLELLDWEGRVETFVEPVVGPNHDSLAFRIVESHFAAGAAGPGLAPPQLADWVKSTLQPVLLTTLEPLLQHFALDLKPLVAAAHILLAGVPVAQGALAQSIVDSLRIERATADDRALTVMLALDAPDPDPNRQPPPAPPLDAEELQRWTAAWQSWDAYATWLIKYLAMGVDARLRDALVDVLFDARHDLLEALAGDETAQDPVRALFFKTWARLEPVLRELQAELPPGDALHYVGFITATDALRNLDQAAPYLGLRIDRDTLRRFARLLLPALQDAALEYSTALDPELRKLLGFGPPLPVEELTTSWLDWLVARAYAAGLDPALVRKLNGRAPTDGDLDAYLRDVDTLLKQLAEVELAQPKVPAQFAPVYRNLLLATAWEETCWRQFEARNGKVQPMQSGVGAIGLMQVNKHVWRGVYDLNQLAADISYNARAGNEILVHYLVDYAIKKGEHKATGDANSLARATYAIYNGGPGQMRRYREQGTKPQLREIDQAFWEKYQALLAKPGAEAVRECYR
ncbi:MAG: lytic transglycosylase domain-containing protein [Gammaproteobacteria bacterium]|nr:lytic transglycosylase domain-containing protein [Gammaproteobacteria bacterium]